jgi:hypothetical protein
MRGLACGIVEILMRIFTTAVVCVSITIKLNEVFKMFCDSVCPDFRLTARGEVCIRDGLLAFDREAGVPVRPN